MPPPPTPRYLLGEMTPKKLEFSQEPPGGKLGWSPGTPRGERTARDGACPWRKIYSWPLTLQKGLELGQWWSGTTLSKPWLVSISSSFYLNLTFMSGWAVKHVRFTESLCTSSQRRHIRQVSFPCLSLLKVVQVHVQLLSWSAFSKECSIIAAW